MALHSRQVSAGYVVLLCVLAFVAGVGASAAVMHDQWSDGYAWGWRDAAEQVKPVHLLDRYGLTADSWYLMKVVPSEDEFAVLEIGVCSQPIAEGVRYYHEDDKLYTEP